MAETAGLVLGVVGAIDQSAQRLSNLKKRFEDFGTLPDNWDSLIKSFEDCETSLKHIKETLVNGKDYISEHANTFRNILKHVEERLGPAEVILKKLEDEFTEQTSSATGSRHVSGKSSKPWGRLLRKKDRFVGGRVVNDGKLFLRANKLKAELEKVDALCKEAQPAIQRLSLALVNQTRSANVYHAHFDYPLLPNKLVLEFSGDTMEACLKRAVLSSSRVTAAVSPSLYGAVGMGGVGKTVALRGLCHELEVRSKYVDGIFFVSLGQDVAEKDIVGCVAHFVKCSGGESLSTGIEQESSAELAARKASVWFKDKCTLFVCDDIWSFDGRPIGYLSSLKELLCNSRSSAMVISTREKSISQKFHEVKFSPREVCGELATRMLANYAGIEIEAVRESSGDWAAFQEILEICAGLPVALGAAGISLRNVIEERNGSIVRSVAIYAHDLSESIEIIGDKSGDEYIGLRAVVETSLRHCEKWVRSAEGQRTLRSALNVRDKFEALSVLRKQGWIPRTSLERLWETNERTTKILLAKFSDMHLAARRWGETPVGEVDGLELHDLMLEQAKIFSIENNRASLWHARFLDGFMRKAIDDVQSSNSYNCREWWECEKLPNDGYIEKNVARHLAMSEGNELKSLLSDVRWSKRRMKVGGIVALRDDFEELSRVCGRDVGADAVRNALEESWVKINKNIHETPFEMYGRLKLHWRSSEFVERFLWSVSKYVPKPHFLPKQEVRWRLHAGQLMRIGFEKKVEALCLSNDQNVIAVTQFDEIHVFDMQAMCNLCTLPGHEAEFTSIAMRGDGSRIVSGSRDHTVRVWDGQSGRCVLGPLYGHDNSVNCVAISADGSRIVSGSDDRTILVWNGESGQCVLGPLYGHDDSVICVAITGDGSRIISGSDDRTILVWDGESGQCVLEPLRGHNDGVTCVALSDHGSRIVSGSEDETVCVWDGESGQRVLGPLHGHDDSVSCVAISGDGSRIVSGSDDHTIRAWDGESGQCILGPLHGHDDWVTCVAISADGRRIVSGSHDHTARVWDGDSGHRVLRPLHGHDDWVTCVAISADGSRIVSGSDDHTIRVWDGESGQFILGPLHGHDEPVICVAITGDGSRIVSGSHDHTVRVWDGESGQCILGPFREHNGLVPCVAISADGRRIVSGSQDETVCVRDGESGQCVLGPLRGHNDSVSCVAISGDGSRIVSGSDDHTIRVWDGESGQCILGPLHGRGGPVICVAVSGDGRRIVSGSHDFFVRVFDGLTGRPKCRALMCKAYINGLEFDVDSDLCLVRTTDEAFLFDSNNGAIVHHRVCVYSRLDGEIYATGENAVAVRVATMPSFRASFCDKLHSIAAIGLQDGQVVIGELVQ